MVSDRLLYRRVLASANPGDVRCNFAKRGRGRGRKRERAALGSRSNDSVRLCVRVYVQYRSKVRIGHDPIKFVLSTLFDSV